MSVIHGFVEGMGWVTVLFLVVACARYAGAWLLYKAGLSK